MTREIFAKRTNWNLETNRLSKALDEHRSAGKAFLDLTASNPTQCGFTCDGEAILRALSNPGALTYDPTPKGLESARRAVAGYYSARGDVVPVEDIFLTTSTSEAYSFVFRTMCNPGDEILIPQPSYPLFDFLAEIQDVKLVRYPLLYDRGWQIYFHALEEAVTERTRGVIVVHPNNPTGHFTKPSEMAKLNEMCVEHQLALIADEVFLDFALGPNQPASFAANNFALSFTMSGLSKIAGLPQMKAAWLIVSGPQELKTHANARLELIADTYLSVNAPVQLAIPTFFDQRQAFRKELMARARANLAALDECLARQGLCSRLELEGGWYAVLRVPATRSDENLAIEILSRTGVFVLPGHFCDFPADGYLIVSLITPETDFAEGTKRILSLF